MSIEISMAWTKGAFLSGEKTVTRRTWSPDYARRIKPGMELVALDKQRRFGGVPIGRIKVLSITRENSSTIPEEDYRAEGFDWMERTGHSIWGKHPRNAFKDWKAEAVDLWVIRFEVIEVGR